jgi:arylsulfatase
MACGCPSRSVRSCSRAAITADLTIPQGGAEGVVTCAGGFSAGWSLYVMNRRPVFRYTFFDIADITIRGTEDLPAGKVTLKTDFTPDGSREGGGVLKLLVNGRAAGEGKMTRSSFRHGLEPFEVGRDSITPIDLPTRTGATSPSPAPSSALSPS